MTTLSLISGQKPKPMKAKRKCKCRGGKHSINANDDYFAIPDRHVRGHYTPEAKRYCISCFGKIMEKTQKDFEECQKNLAKCVNSK